MENYHLLKTTIFTVKLSGKKITYYFFSTHFQFDKKPPPQKKNLFTDSCNQTCLLRTYLTPMCVWKFGLVLLYFGNSSFVPG